jgi:hypothetical protein
MEPDFASLILLAEDHAWLINLLIHCVGWSLKVSAWDILKN